MSTSTTARISFIDVSKAICIFLMVIGHQTSNELLFTYIYSFHMPALFIISGYLFKACPWYKTMLAFSIPVVCFSFLNLIVQILLGDLFISDISISQTISLFLHYRYGLSVGLFSGDWFLWALIGLRCIFGDILPFKILRKHYIAIAFFCVVYMTFESYLISIDTIFRGYYIGRMVPSLVFFCIGFFLADHKWTPHNFTFYFVPIFVVLFFLLPLFNGKCSINSNTYGISYLLFVLNAVISSILLFVLAEKIPNTKFITTISKGTLVVLGMHMPIIRILYYLLPNSIDFLFPVFTIIICYYIIIVCQHFFPLLLGKSDTLQQISILLKDKKLAKE